VGYTVRVLRLLACGALIIGGSGCGNPCAASSRFEPNISLDAGPVCQWLDAGAGGLCYGNRQISCPAGCACYSLKTVDACGTELYHGTAACHCGVNPSTNACDAPDCGGIHCGGFCADADAGRCNLGV
jgi:hypothetical protein